LTSILENEGRRSLSEISHSRSDILYLIPSIIRRHEKIDLVPCEIGYPVGQLVTKLKAKGRQFLAVFGPNESF